MEYRCDEVNAVFLSFVLTQNFVQKVIKRALIQALDKQIFN